jgi:hypothetical protein
MNFNRVLRNLILLIFGSLFGCSGVDQNIIYVKKDAKAGGDGSSWEMAFNDLQIALNSAEMNSEIWVAKEYIFPTKLLAELRIERRVFN